MYLFLIYFIIVLLSTNCNGHYEKTCSVFPKDPFIEAGSDAEIMCQSSCVSGKVFWTLNNSSVNESLSHRINSSHTVLVLPYSELQDHDVTVQCHSVKNHQILGGTIIKTYTKPHNLACIWHSDKEKNKGSPRLFTCSWEHHIKKNQLKINYSVICPRCPVDRREICNSGVTNCTTTTTSALQDQLSTSRNNTIYVRAKTEAWEANSSNYTFSFLQIFKIPPRELNVTAHMDHILVDWDCLPKTKVNGQCQVKYKYTKDEETIKVLNKTLKNNLDCEKKEKLTIDEVESCTEYSVSVRCALDHAPWSYWSEEKTVLTKLKKRAVKLDVWRKVSKLQGKRKVHILWKGIPSNCQGTFSYRVKQASYDELTSTANYTEILCGNYSCDITVNQEAQRVNLTVFYNEGFLAEESFYLPADAESDTHSLLRVDDIETKHDKSGLVVCWKAPSEPVSGYLIDWTYNGKEFDWKKSNFTNTTLDGLIDKRPYNITVTPLFGDKPGPSTHVFGVCSSFAEPGNVTILDVETYDKSAHVSWSVKSQNKCSDVVVDYTVFYGAPNGPQFNVTVKNTVQDVYLKNLNPNTQYNVHVVATARAGNAKSNDRLFMTKRFDPRLITVLSVTGSILIILILSLGLFCAILWRKFIEKPVPNPGLSSLALWPQTTLQKAAFPFEPFNTPSESLCDTIYTEEMQTSVITGYNSNLTSDQGDLTLPSPQNYERPSLSLKASHLPCPRESTSLLPTENSPTVVSPYRSQVTIESPAPRTSKQLKRLPLKLQEKTPSYVSLDFLFDRDQ